MQKAIGAKQNRIFFVFFAILICLVLLPNRLAAESGLAKKCKSAEFARQCPQTCKDYCENSKNVPLSMMKSCASIWDRVQDGARDESSCRTAKPKKAKRTYNECKKGVDAYFKEFKKPKAPIGPLRQVFTNRPDCATPLIKLAYQFRCLSDASKTTTDGVNELVRAGLSNLDDINKLCKLRRTDFEYYTKLSSTLISKGEVLTTNFADLDSCRTSLVGWTGKLKAACKNSTFPNCDNIVTKLEKSRAPMLNDITRLSNEMRIKLTKVKSELGNIKFMESAALDCGFQGNSKIEDLDMKKIFKDKKDDN
jgi:hypothetical protein